MKLPPSSIESTNCDCVPYMRYGHSASAIGEKVYIFGGRNDTQGSCNTLFRFDTGENSCASALSDKHPVSQSVIGHEN